ncbi:MAG: hypothetical protein JST62_08980 [Bacteroidetes bacterium]|nr:hypothetical protein [Bacteroidota bacterium]
MKKVFLAVSIIVLNSLSAQTQLSVKAHLIVPTSSSNWSDINKAMLTTYSESGKNSMGYNIGLSAKTKLPGNSFFLMPEVYYTEYKNEFVEPSYNTNLVANTKRIDVPVLLGANIFENYFSVFVGPIAHINLKSNDTFNDIVISKNNTQFNLGYQIGAEISIEKIIISGRYEGSFSKDDRQFINNSTGTEINYTNSQNVLYLGLGYIF